jgi:FtsZ-binding cell division protein ZapB
LRKLIYWIDTLSSENEVLKTIVSRLQEENEKMQEEKKKLAKQVKKWYARSQNVMIENR